MFGVVSRGQLRQLGITRHQIRTHVVAGRLRVLGTQAVHVLAAGWWDERSPIVAAVLNAGDSAWADGQSALLLAGLRGWRHGRAVTVRRRPSSAWWRNDEWRGPRR